MTPTFPLTRRTTLKLMLQTAAAGLIAQSGLAIARVAGAPSSRAAGFIHLDQLCLDTTGEQLPYIAAGAPPPPVTEALLRRLAFL
jgi:hypothetical protein